MLFTSDTGDDKMWDREEQSEIVYADLAILTFRLLRLFREIFSIFHVLSPPNQTYPLLYPFYFIGNIEIFRLKICDSIFTRLFATLITFTLHLENINIEIIFGKKMKSCSEIKVGNSWHNLFDLLFFNLLRLGLNLFLNYQALLYGRKYFVRFSIYYVFIVDSRSFNSNW